MIDQSQERWLARIGDALATSARWILLGTGVALAIAAWGLSASSGSLIHLIGLWSLCTSSLIQIYLIVRIEFDARIFRHVAIDTSQSDEDDWSAFDAAMAQAKLRSPLRTTRATSSRVRGTLRLVRWMAVVMAAQWVGSLILATVPS
jgi:hypothetical protein